MTRKLILVLIAILLLPFVFSTTVFAKDYSDTKTLESNEIINSDYFSHAENVTLNGTVNGDAYLAGGTVLMNGTVNGDLIVAGGDVTISGNIKGDIRVVGGDVTITNATIEQNITAVGGSITVDQSTKLNGSIVALGGDVKVLAPVEKGVTIAGGSILIANSVGSDVRMAGGELTLSPDASINGNLTYWSERKATIPSSATISGAIKQEPPKNLAPSSNPAKQGADVAAIFGGIILAMKIMDTILLLIAGLLFIKLLPIFTKSTSELTTKKLGLSILIGLVAGFGIPFICFILLITFIGIPLSIVLFFSYVLLFWIGRIFAIYALGNILMEKLGRKDGRYASYTIGLVTLLIISLIPIIGPLVNLLVSLSGVGALLISKKNTYNTLRSKKLI